MTLQQVVDRLAFAAAGTLLAVSIVRHKFLPPRTWDWDRAGRTSVTLRRMLYETEPCLKCVQSLALLLLRELYLSTLTWTLDDSLLERVRMPVGISREAFFADVYVGTGMASVVEVTADLSGALRTRHEEFWRRRVVDVVEGHHGSMLRAAQLVELVVIDLTEVQELLPCVKHIAL